MTSTPQRRKAWILALAAVVLVLFALLGMLNAFHLNAITPATTLEIFVYTALSTVAFLLFVTLLVLLVRNVLKLYAEQRTHLLGVRLRTRMLWGAVLMSLVPIAFMFAFSYLLMNRAVDRWFSQPVTQMRDGSNRIAEELAQYTAANARAEAESIAQGLVTAEVRRGPANAGTVSVDGTLREHEITLQGGFALVVREGAAPVGVQMPRTRAGRPALNEAGLLEAARQPGQPIVSAGAHEYVLGTATTPAGEAVVVGLPVPTDMTATMAGLHRDAESYWTLFRLRRQLRNLYTLLLLMITALALFACCWLALYLSKQVTRPVEALAEAMDLLAAGDYGQRLQSSPTDELAELARSFNRMAADLESSRRAVLDSSVQISAANAALEVRRSELETMLETIPNGVATLSRTREIVLANRGFSEMLDPGGQRTFLGSRIEQVTPPELAEVLDRLLRRSHRMGSASAELELAQRGPLTNVLATVALLETGTERGREHQGYVVVLENATELLRAQKQMAWKEVARRVAHEIKNPLTPIALSAEQTRRHIDRLAATLAERGIESPSVAIIRRCSETTSSSVESMRGLVDQFSSLAEFPAAQPRPADLNTIVENALALFAGRLQSIRIVRSLQPGLPLVLADPEALKRALSNLIDNAAEAMQSALLRELSVGTALLPSGDVELVLADTGGGLTDEMRERLFLPYFSTKQRGTGLGLAIAAKIVQEHGGTIRAESNTPVGARFTLELKAAPAAEDEVPETMAAEAVAPAARPVL